MKTKAPRHALQKKIQELEARLKLMKRAMKGSSHPPLNAKSNQTNSATPAHVSQEDASVSLMNEGQAPYRAMLESMRDPLFICSPQMKISYMNPPMIRLVGRDAVGETCHDIIHGQEEICPWCEFDRIKSGETVYSEIISPRDGREYSITNSPIYHSNGKISLMCIFRDITGIRKMESEQDKNLRLESIGTLAGGIAHDYNNLLSVMLGNLSLAKAYGRPGAKQEIYLRRIERAILKTRDLTRRILLFSQESSPSESSRDLIQVARDIAQHYIHAPNIEFKFSGPDHQWPASYDQKQIAYVIENLLLNAVQAMPKGGTLTVNVENCDLHSARRAAEHNLAAGPYLHVSVHDEGQGIQPAHIAKVFDPYFSTRQRSTQKGMGLGLATAYAIIKNHNGKLTVESTWKKGSTFAIYLPAVAPKMHIREAISNQRLRTKVTP